MMYPHDHDADAGHGRCERCGSYDDCGEECVALYDSAKADRERPMNIRWLYAACRIALALAHSYRSEDGPNGRRYRAALATVRSYRNDIRALRAGGFNGIRQSDKAAE